MSEDEHLQWLIDEDLENPTLLTRQACITVVTGMRPDDVLRAFGTGPGGTTMPLADVIDERHVSVTQVGDHVVAAEKGGGEALQRELAAELSSRGRAATVHWNENALVWVAFAEGGSLLGSLQPTEWPIELPAELKGVLPEPAAIPLREAHLRADAGATLLLEHFMGLQLTMELVTGLSPQAHLIPS